MTKQMFVLTIIFAEIIGFAACGKTGMHEHKTTSPGDRLEGENRPIAAPSRETVPSPSDTEIPSEHDKYTESDPSECTSWCIVPVDGWLAPGLEEKDVLVKLGPPNKKGELFYEEATALEKQYWEYRSLGLRLEMVKDSGPQMSVNSIMLGEGSNLKTPEGIGIGSARNKVESLYGETSNPDYTNNERLVIGSIYWGTGFYFDDGLVSHILIGVSHGN